MLRTIFFRYGRRSFSKSTLRSNLEKVTPKQELRPNETKINTSERNDLLDFKPSEFEKFILVWSGKFKSKESIPDRISFSTMDNAKSRFRIRGSNILMAASLLVCGIYVYVGKKRQKAGDTITKRVLERDAKILADAQKNT